MSAPIDISPHGFFDVLLPALLQDRAAAARQVDAVIQFYLLDVARTAWFADLTHAELPVVAGEHPQADLTIDIDSHCLDPLVTGTLDVEAAIDDEQLSVYGDPEVLRRLSDLFTGGQSWLQARSEANRGAP